MSPILTRREFAADSRRCDYLTTSFVLHDEQGLDDLMALAYSLNDLVDRKDTFSRPRAAKHFCFASQTTQTGITMEWSPISSSTDGPIYIRNEGRAILSLSGDFWGSIDALDRGQVYNTIRDFRGFKRATRLDLQITKLSPEIGAGDLVELVEAGKLWPKGFGQGYAYGRRDYQGGFVGVPSQYFGGKESRVTARVYDKAQESSWETEAVRHELVLRKEPADQWFRRLAKETAMELDQPALFQTKEALVVNTALSQHLDYRDTSRWAGKTKPEKWWRTAKRPEWWDSLLVETTHGETISYRKDNTLDETVEHMVEQYGRKVGLWVLARAGTDVEANEDVLWHLYVRMVNKIREDDVDFLMSEWPDTPKEEILELMSFLTKVSQRISEEVEPPRSGKIPPRG